MYPVKESEHLYSPLVRFSLHVLYQSQSLFVKKHGFVSSVTIYLIATSAIIVTVISCGLCLFCSFPTFDPSGTFDCANLLLFSFICSLSFSYLCKLLEKLLFRPEHVDYHIGGSHCT